MMVNCCQTSSCASQRKAIRKELLTWNKNIPLVMGMEAVAERPIGKKTLRFLTQTSHLTETEIYDWSPQVTCSFCTIQDNSAEQETRSGVEVDVCDEARNKDSPLDLSITSSHSGLNDSVTARHKSHSHEPNRKKTGRVGVSRRNYTEEELEAATAEVCSNKLGTRRASILYGIPRSTLRNKIVRLRARGSVTSGPQSPSLKAWCDSPTNHSRALGDQDKRSANEKNRFIDSLYENDNFTSNDVKDLLLPADDKSVVNTSGASYITTQHRPKSNVNDHKNGSRFAKLSSTKELLLNPYCDTVEIKKETDDTDFIDRFNDKALRSFNKVDKRTCLEPAESKSQERLRRNHFRSRFVKEEKQDEDSIDQIVQQIIRKRIRSDLANGFMSHDVSSISQNVNLTVKTCNCRCKTKSNRSDSAQLVVPQYKSKTSVTSADIELDQEVSQCSCTLKTYPQYSSLLNKIFKEIIEKTVKEKLHDDVKVRYDDTGLLSDRVRVKREGGVEGRAECETSSGGNRERLETGWRQETGSRLDGRWRQDPSSGSNSPDVEERCGYRRESGSGSGSDTDRQRDRLTYRGMKRTRPKRGQYRKYNRELLLEAVRAVQQGDMSVHRAGTYYGVPHSTLEYKVKERHLLRQRKINTASERRRSTESLNSIPPSSVENEVKQADHQVKLSEERTLADSAVRREGKNSLGTLLKGGSHKTESSTLSSWLPHSDSLFNSELTDRFLGRSLSAAGLGISPFNLLSSTLPAGFGWPNLFTGFGSFPPFFNSGVEKNSVSGDLEGINFQHGFTASDLLKKLQQKAETNAKLND